MHVDCSLVYQAEIGMQILKNSVRFVQKHDIDPPCRKDRLWVHGLVIYSGQSYICR